ncbi:hypothetical protein CEP51_016693 [Fusarium floridanum]|uniref:Uncharacterized protein n=1 Tax=Fusarium floridanum TaxID=1325733 RepID=A0A428NIB1_9HYPO|nr:hypothetical protein CEP51_016693 [Fusarium floridanum]
MRLLGVRDLVALWLGGLSSLRNQLLDNPDIDRFWQNDTDARSQIHPVAREWLDKILTKDLQGVSALRDLVRVEECESNLHFILTEVANTTQPWLNVTDNGTARTLISRLDWPTSRVCDPCAALDFQLPTLDLRRSIEELSNGSDKCSLCHFLFRCLTKAKPKPDKPLRLLRDDASHTLRVPGSASPVMSIYLDPASKDNTPSYAQLGLPILPECTSEQQFKVLNEWINLCDTTHNCNSAQEHDGHMDSMPTRVIDVGTVDSPSL